MLVERRPLAYAAKHYMFEIPHISAKEEKKRNM